MWDRPPPCQLASCDSAHGWRSARVTSVGAGSQHEVGKVWLLKMGRGSLAVPPPAMPPVLGWARKKHDQRGSPNRIRTKADGLPVTPLAVLVSFAMTSSALGGQP
jgi:hypothetical protein